MPDVEALKLFLLGVTPGRPPGPTLAPKLGFTPRVLWLSARPGVGWRLGGCFLNGLSGRGRDGLFGLKEGLGGLAPGPIVCANLCCGKDGVGEGSVSGEFCVPEEGEERFSARCTGKKMPEPGMEVLKYCTLHVCQRYRTNPLLCCKLTHRRRHHSSPAPQTRDPIPLQQTGQACLSRFRRT